MNDKEFDKIKKKLKFWQNRVPSYVLKLTPEEIYIHGFNSGYKCRVSELGMKDLPIFEFEFKKPTKHNYRF